MKYNIRCMPRLKPIYFCGHWQGTPLGAMGGLACAAIVHLVRVMRSHGRRLDFLGLSGTMIGEGEARSLADALNALPDRDPEVLPEVIELKQLHLSEPVRDLLTKAGTRAGVDVLFSQVDGPALRPR